LPLPGFAIDPRCPFRSDSAVLVDLVYGIAKESHSRRNLETFDNCFQLGEFFFLVILSSFFNRFG